MSALLNRAVRLSKEPYKTILFRNKVNDNEYAYVAVHPELNGCYAQGDTPEEAYANLEGVTITHIEHLLLNGLDIPEAVTEITNGVVQVAFNMLSEQSFFKPL